MSTNIANTEITNPTTITKTLSIKDFCTEKGFVEIKPLINKNVNGYPFITFITGGNVAENVYFSKNAAKIVPTDNKISKELFSKLIVTFLVNEDGEERIKLSLKNETNRVSIDSFF